ncbi:MAG: SGNH hydrolase domain-containing protein, partial [Pseudomonadota bacterium]
QEFAAFAAAHDIHNIAPADFLCDKDRCYIYREGLGVLYYNQGHLSLKGAGLLADAIEVELADMPRTPAAATSATSPLN